MRLSKDNSYKGENHETHNKTGSNGWRIACHHDIKSIFQEPLGIHYRSYSKHGAYNRNSFTRSCNGHNPFDYCTDHSISDHRLTDNGRYSAHHPGHYDRQHHSLCSNTLLL